MFPTPMLLGWAILFTWWAQQCTLCRVPPSCNRPTWWAGPLPVTFLTSSPTLPDTTCTKAPFTAVDNGLLRSNITKAVSMPCSLPTTSPVAIAIFTLPMTHRTHGLWYRGCVIFTMPRSSSMTMIKFMLSTAPGRCANLPPTSSR